MEILQNVQNLKANCQNINADVCLNASAIICMTETHLSAQQEWPVESSITKDVYRIFRCDSFVDTLERDDGAVTA